MDLEHAIGTILCDGCGAKYTARITRLTDPIDVYAEWIDASEAVNAPGGAARGTDDVADDDEAAEDDY